MSLKSEPNDNAKQMSFNWDSFDVGNFHLEHSQRYFATAHSKHERLERLAKQELENAHTNCCNMETNSQHTDCNCNCKDKVDVADMPIKQEMCKEMEQLQITAQTVQEDNKENIVVLHNYEAAEQQQEQCDNKVVKTTTDDLAAKTLPGGSAISKPEIQQTNKPANIVLEPPIPCGLGAVRKNQVKTNNVVPRAYDFQQIYQRKQQQALVLKLEHERRMREFHARQMPKFAEKKPKPNKHIVTFPETPKVLKHSKDSQQLLQQKLEEMKRQQQPVKFEARDANVLREQPFVPKKQSKTIEVQPFKLNTLERLQKRKEYDAKVQRALLEKCKQEEEQKKKLNEEILKKIRQETIFKARPNPFK